MKILSVILIITLVLVGALQFDDDLAPEAVDWISVLENSGSGDSDSYIYLNGIMAAETDDVMSVGRKRFAAYRSAEAKISLSSEAIQYVDYPKGKWLSIPISKNPLYCRLWEKSCFENVLQARGKWEAELEKRKTILLRYRNYLKLSDFKTLSKAYVSEIFPRYEYLAYGNRLQILEVLVMAENNMPKEAIEILVQDIYRLRRQLVMADNLIHKMIFTIMISNNLSYIAYISSTANIVKKEYIPFLTREERDMELPMIREFGMAFYSFTEIDRSPELFKTGGNMPSWIVRAVYKPNMTTNDIIPAYEEAIYAARLPSEKFAEHQAGREEVVENEINWRNYVGHTLVSIAHPDYYRYIARLHDLNVKISLVNYVMSGRTIPLVNPYYPSLAPQVPDGNKICLSGPYEDDRELRCIRTK